MPAILRVLQTLVLVFLWTANAVATEFTVHGPDQFIRYYGEPLREVVEFSVPNSRADYTIRVHNGWGVARRVRAARIFLNGEQIFGPRDFHKGMMDHYEFDDLWSKEKRGRKWRSHRANFKKWDLSETIVMDQTVALAESNTLEVVLYGIPQKPAGGFSGFLKKIHNFLPPFLQDYLNSGSGLAVEFLGQGDEPPAIAVNINPAANDSGWHNQAVEVNFECSDENSGIQSCSDPVVVDRDGRDQIVTGTALNNAGIQASVEVQIHKDSVAPTLESTNTPQMNSYGWSNLPVTVSYTCTDELSGLFTDACPEDVMISAEGKDQEISASLNDIAGNSTSLLSKVSVDTSKPIIDASVQPMANDLGWHKQDAVVVFACDDNLSGVNGCTPNQTVAREGQGIAIVGQVEDFAGNKAEVAVAINLDKTPPVVISSYEPQANSNGWHKSSVTIGYQCNDTLSGVSNCPVSQTISTDGAAQAIVKQVRDNAGNAVSVESMVNIDRTAPAITYNLSEMATGSGWHNQDVTIDFVCEDLLSGIQVCTDSITVGTEGAAIDNVGNAIDLAGNSAEASVQINLDKTSPSVTQKVSPDANVEGWHNSNVTLSFQCDDALSGIDICPVSEVVGSEGSNLSISKEVSDKAGNKTTVDAVLNIDKTAPAIAAKIGSTANSNGWYKESVIVDYVCEDQLSGVADCSSPNIIDTEGLGVSVIGRAMDIAGNSSEISTQVNLDKTEPAVIQSILPSANVHGWHNSDVTLGYQCSDALSGVVVCPAQEIFTIEGADQKVTVDVSDEAGNVVTVESTFNIDKTVPLINANFSSDPNAAGWYNSDVLIEFTCEDSLSGVDSCNDQLTFTLEGRAQQVNASASDRAGNTINFLDEINIDKTSPVLTQVVTPDANANGWYNQPVSIAYHCEDLLSGVVASGPDACPDNTTIATNGADQSVSVVVRDNAGNQAKLTTVFNIDTLAPTIEFTSPLDGGQLDDPVPVISINLFDNISIDESTFALVVTDDDGSAPAICGLAGSIATCNLDRELVGEAVLSATVSDLAGNTTSVSITVVANVDTDGDGILDHSDQCPLTTPGYEVGEDGCDDTQRDSDQDGVLDVNDAFPHNPSETSDLDGDGIGDNSDGDIDGDGVANGQDIFPEDPKEHADMDGDGIGDNGDQDRDGDGVANASDAYPEDAARSKLPIVTIDSPATLVTVGSSPIIVTGSADPSFTSLTVNGVPVSISGGKFAANVKVTEGFNSIVARAVDADGTVSTASISVSLDLTPPYVTIDSHKHEQVVYTDRIMVSGLINDIVRGTVEAEQASVTVNGVQAQIANRSYRVENVALTEGQNTITVIGADQVGNKTTQIIHVFYKQPSGNQIVIESGQNQTASINQIVYEPLAVKVLDESGVAVANKNVVFRVVQGSGSVISNTNEEARAHVVTTDTQGMASVLYRVGQRAGVSNHKVEAKVVGYENSANFYASATGDIGNKISVNSGNNQRGSVFQPLPAPFIVAVTDVGSNVVAGARVLFETTVGGGTFNDASSIIVLTDSDGRAAAQMTLGSLTGLDQQRVVARLLDAPEGETITATFTATGYYPQDPALTSITGTVLNNQDEPLPNVTVLVDGTTRQGKTDAEGVFKITEAPVGPVHLIIDGSTTTSEGEYPTLTQNIVTVSGVENPLAAPVYMVKLNTENAVLAGPEDVSVTLPDVPGFELEIQKDSVTFPDGSREGLVSVTTVNASKVPMAPPNGMQPQFIVTIQPTGTRFDPPAQLTLPNVDAYAPGAQVEMFSYDHDLEEFVAIGLGTVSNDGSVVKSNQGVGVIKAGWHCGAEPGGAGSCGNDDCTGPTCNEPDDDDKGPPDCSSGNPINLATGEKYQTETDFVGPGPFPLKIERTYQSKGHGRATGRYWSFSNEYESSGGLAWMPVPCNAKPPQTCPYPPFYQVEERLSKLRITEPNGTITKFDLKAYTDEYRKDDGSVLKVINRWDSPFNNSYREDYAYIKPSGEKIIIRDRKITQVEDDKGNYKYYSQRENTVTITDQFGNSVDYAKNQDGQTNSATYRRQDGETLLFTYEYDDQGRLVKANYPGDKFKIYHYENERWPNGLTGITDESGVRFATWQYDNYGRAILSEHALEAERKSIRYGKVEPIDFDDPDWAENRKWRERTVTETNELGKQTTYTFDYSGRTLPSKVEGHASTSCVAANKEYTYTINGQVRSKTDWKGNKTRYEYNDRGLETLRVEAEGTPQERRFETNWHDSKSLPLKRISAGMVLEYEYDDKGNVTKLIRGNRIQTFAYSDLGQMLKMDGSRMDVADLTYYEYNANGHLVRQTNAVGHVIHLQDYNVFNQPTRLVDANGVVTLLEYDARGRLSKSTVKSRDGDVVTSYVTNAVGLVTRITPPNGSAIDFEYDDARRLIAISNKQGERIEYSVDAMGNITEQRILDGSGSLAYRHVNLFDELGRLIKDVGTNEQIITDKYDANGNVVESIDGNGNPTAYAFDPLDRLVSSINANNHTAQFAYDKQDNLTSVTDQRGLITQYEYNEHNEVVKLISPDTGTTTFVRDSAGNITSKTDARGVVTNYTYDAINRILTKTFPSDPSRNIAYRYDDQYTAEDATVANYNAGKGRLTYVSDHSGTTQYRYDDRGNVIADKRVINLGGTDKVQETLYSYDLDNQLVQMDYPTGIRLYFVRDDLGRINQIRLGEDSSVTIERATVIAENISYLPFGTVKSLAYGNGLNLSREYDQDYRITHIEVSDALDLVYEYDTNNNIVAINNDLIAEQSAAFEYDGLNRLQTEAKNQNQITYEYDEVGNRTLRTLQTMPAANDSAEQGAGQQAQAAEAIETEYTYAANSNQLKTISGNAVSHDAVGNIFSLPAMSSQHTSGDSTITPVLSFTYDAVNRLSSVSKSGQFQASYFYNTQGQRVLKQLHSVGRTADYIVYHYNLNGQVIGETYYKAGVVIQHKAYIWLGNIPVAMVDKKGSSDLDVTYIHADHLNTPRSATDLNKAVVWNWLSDAFGDGAANNDVDDDGVLTKVNLRLPGQVFDEESKRYYNYFRDYDPILGRYIEGDPIGLIGGLNIYSYTGENPISYMDDDGLTRRGGGVFNSRNATRIRNIKERMETVREAMRKNKAEQKRIKESIDDVLDGLREQLDQLRKELDDLRKDLEDAEKENDPFLPTRCAEWSCPWDDDRQNQCNASSGMNGGRNAQSGCDCKFRLPI